MFALRLAKAQTKAGASSTIQLAPQRSTFAARPFGGSAVAQAHVLQRSIGNQATLRLLAQRGSSLTGNELHGHYEQETGPASLTASEAAPSASWDFSKIPIFSPDRTNQPQALSSLSAPRPSSVIQPKLVVGEVNDPLEREADRAAEHVMRTPDPAAIPPHKRRACACGGTCPSCRGKQPEHVQQTSAFGEQSEAPPIVTEVLRAPGQPFDTATRALMERRFRHDFSRVRLHTDAKANASAVAVNARAYTVGPHIVFGTEQFAPATAEGRKLIVHELAHVVQQGDAGTGIRSALKIGPAGDTHEREAERFAETVVAETPGLLAPEFSPRSSAALSLQRDQCKKSDDHIPTGPLTPPPFNFDCEPSPATLAAVRAVPGVPPTILGITETSMVDQGLTFTEGKGSRCTAAVNSYATLQNTNFLYTKAGDHPDGTEITPAGRACKEGTRVAKVLRVTDKGAETLKLGEKEHCEDHKLAFTLSHSKYNQAIKELEGAYCAAGTTPVGGQICGPEFAKRFKDRTGIDFDQRQTIAECLLKKSSLRDDRKWHDAHPRTWSYDRDCRTVTYIIDPSALPEVGRHPSSEIVKGCGEDGVSANPTTPPANTPATPPANTPATHPATPK